MDGNSETNTGSAVMSKPYNIFISWSGIRSRHIAAFLREWLPTVLQSTHPWMSEADIDKGSRGLDEIKAALTDIKIGITCLTPENINAAWILYEAGGLTKTVDDKTRLCTYLLGGLKPQQIPPPLGMFQHTIAEKADTRRLISTINRVVGDGSLSDLQLDNLFNKFWPDLEEKLKNMPPAEEEAPPTRNELDMIAEILDLSRAAANSRQQVNWMDQYVPVLQKLFPLLDQAVANAQGLFTLVSHDRPKFSDGSMEQRFEKFHTIKAAIQRACNLMELPDFHDPFIMVGDEVLCDKNQLTQAYKRCKEEIHNACRKQNVDLASPENAFIVAKFTPQGPLLKAFPERELANNYVQELSKSGNPDLYIVNALP
jgi:hypothetical protein